MTGSPAVPAPKAGGLSPFVRRHPELWVGAVVLAAWLALIAQAAGHGDHRQWSPAQAQLHWLLMAAAMMLTPALPMVRHVALNSLRRRRGRSVAIFGGAVLAFWGAFGLVAVSAAQAAGIRGGAWVGAALLVAAVWELTPAKRRSLKACHRAPVLPARGRAADRACLAAGLDYSRACFGACWALMAAMVVAAPPALPLMVLLTVVVVGQEWVSRGHRLAGPASVVLASVGMVLLVTAGAA